MQAWRHVQPSGTNSPGRSGARRTCRRKEIESNITGRKPGAMANSDSFAGGVCCCDLRIADFRQVPFQGHLGDDSTRAPPLPIPNREVKPRHADGTAKAGE